MNSRRRRGPSIRFTRGGGRLCVRGEGDGRGEERRRRMMEEGGDDLLYVETSVNDEGMEEREETC